MVKREDTSVDVYLTADGKCLIRAGSTHKHKLVAYVDNALLIERGYLYAEPDYDVKFDDSCGGDYYFTEITVEQYRFGDAIPKHEGGRVNPAYVP